MRNLASIQRIGNLEPIQNADAIEKATVLGWQLVVKKGEFAINDLCVYCEIDSILPEKPEFEFLRERKFRIKTIIFQKLFLILYLYIKMEKNDIFDIIYNNTKK